MMSRTYDNWEKLVGAVLRREKDRQLAYCESFSTTSSTDFSSRFSFDIPFVGDFHVSAGWIDEHQAAVLPGSGIAVAVKILNNTRNMKLEEWMDELNNLSQLRHPNLLTPIGYSFDTDQRILVYEFMPKGSLNNHLFTSWQRSLPWAPRIKVAVGAARALAFSHDLAIPVMYRILKSDDILLDADFNAKLSGIDLRKDLSIHEIEGPLGIIKEVGDAYGPYAAPEYIASGHLSTECDVYSFGVVLVELITGRRALDRNRPAGEHNLMDWAKPYLRNKRRFLQIMHRRLEGEYPHKDAYKVGQIALHCVSSYPRSRPRMAEVVAALQ